MKNYRLFILINFKNLNLYILKMNKLFIKNNFNSHIKTFITRFQKINIKFIVTKELIKNSNKNNLYFNLTNS